MFYPVDVTPSDPNKKQIAALAVLNPQVSRRLIGKATAACGLLQSAWKEGMVIIARSISTAYVSEELLGVTIENKANQTVGFVGEGITNAHVGPPPCTDHVFINGQSVENADSTQEINKFKQGDVFIKGANAVDHTGTAGIWVASSVGGTVGMSWHIVTPRRAEYIIPCGLEKMVPCVMDSYQHSGLEHYKYSTGLPAALVPVPAAKVITEIQAVGILFDVAAYHVASGGVAGSEGSVHLAIEGDEDKVEAAFNYIKSIRNEAPIGPPTAKKLDKAEDFDFDAAAQLASLGM